MARFGDFCKWSLLPALLMSVGCTGDGRLKGNDPLSGGGPAIPPRTETAAANPPREDVKTTGMTRSTVPPLPAPSSSTSTAALANGAFQPLDPTRELRIGNGDPIPTSGTWHGPANAATATLNPPQPINDPKSSGQLTSNPQPAVRPIVQPPAPLQPINGPAGASADALLTTLQERGVTWHRLETWGDNGEWKYTCSVPNASNPNIRRNYEARGRDPRTAMLAVLTQMDQERR